MAARSAPTPRRRDALTRPGQGTFDELGRPLAEVTFCVIDLETTGASPAQCEITEVAAARYEGGRCTGTFQTLVNPGVPIPPQIVYLTGITEAMVGPAPRIEAVLPSLLEFVGDAVIVGHNVRFDLGFLHAAMERNRYERFTNPVIDTVRLARRLVREEVANCRLGTLSAHFGFANQPTHRALDDVRATADLLHLLLERAAGFGVMGLDDLVELPAINRHPQAGKLRLTDALPRSPGVYLFRDRDGRIVYVGKATNLRARVRSYFSSDDRRKIEPLLRALHRIDHVACRSPIEAAVLEVRLIQRHLPPFNRQAKLWTQYAYVRVLLPPGKKPSIATTKDAGGVVGARYLGPFPSVGAARVASLALKHAAVAHGPAWVELLDAPDLLLAPLHEQMRELAAQERFEEAAALRDRAGTLARGMDRQRKAAALRAAGWTELEVRQGDRRTPMPSLVLRVDHGRIRFGDGRADATAFPGADAPVPRDQIDELSLLASWLERQAGRVRVRLSDGGLAWPMRPVPRFDPRLPRGAEDHVRRAPVPRDNDDDEQRLAS